jgi:hypothetical protein
MAKHIYNSEMSRLSQGFGGGALNKLMASAVGGASLQPFYARGTAKSLYILSSTICKHTPGFFKNKYTIVLQEVKVCYLLCLPVLRSNQQSKLSDRWSELGAGWSFNGV